MRSSTIIRDDVIAELIGSDARFGMTMGDIVFDDMSMFPALERDHRPDRHPLVQRAGQSRAESAALK